MDEKKETEARPQTEDEIRRRLRKQGKISETPKKKDDGVHEVTDEEALVRIEERKEREADEATEENPLVRPLTNKDIALRKAATKDREEKDEGKEGPRVQTEEDIKKRNDPNPDDEKTEPEEGSGPPEVFAKDVVSFKDDDGKVITGKVIRVTAKGEAVVDTEDAEYTVSCKDLTKEEKGEE